MKIKDALNYGFEILKNKNIDSYHLDTELILTFALKKKKEWILSNPDFFLNINQIKKFKKLVLKRSKNYPTAYILGHKYFYNLKFKVNKNVLIPRPETELLVESTRRVTLPDGWTILDVGTGSGAIAISLAKKLKDSKILASDNSKFALNIAKKNARANNIKNIKFIKSNLLEKFKNDKLDIIVANLPYVKNNWNNASIKYEPYNALYSGKTGLVHYFKLLKQIKELEYKPKYVLLEIDPEQVEAISKQAKKLFTSNIKIDIKKDLAGLDRVIIINL